MATKFFLILLLCVSWCDIYSQVVNCKKEISAKLAVLSCYKAVGLEMFADVGVIVALVRNPEVVCRNEERFLEAVECTLQIVSNCLTVSKDFIITLASIKTGTRMLCNETRGLNFICAKKANSKIHKCLGNNRKMETSVSSEEIYCRDWQIIGECTIELLPACGCITTQVYVEFFKAVLPIACGELNVSTPDCSLQSKELSEFQNVYSMGNSQTVSLVPCLTFALYTLYTVM